MKRACYLLDAPLLWDMKNSPPKIALVFLLLLPLLGRAQENVVGGISGRVVDANTKAPIPSTSISLRNSGIGAFTDEHGRFRLASLKSIQQDSIVIINLAYENYSELIKTDNSKELVIELTRRNSESVRVRDTGFVCHLSSRELEPYAERELTAGTPGRQYAFFIANEKRRQFGKLRTVSFYIGENGLPMKSFRICIYKADGNYYAPKTSLLNERLFINTNSLGKWCSINLGRYNIAVPEDGYFVALEFGNPTNSLAQPVLENYIPSGLVMRPAIKYRKSIIWSYRPEKSWSLCSKTEGLHRFDAMVRVEVEAAE